MKTLLRLVLIMAMSFCFMQFSISSWAGDVRGRQADAIKSPSSRALKVKEVKKAAKPDLVITKINVSPGQPKQHENITYWVFVKNIGPGNAKASFLSITDSKNATPIWSKVAVPALDPGREWRFEGPRQFNQAGTYTLTAVIDRENKIAETKEGNNVLTTDIVVSKP